LRKQRKGQPLMNQKVNLAEKSRAERAYGVDPQEQVSLQEKVFRQEMGLTNSNANLMKNNGNEDDLEQRLEGITGQRLRNKEREQLRAMRDSDFVIAAMDTFSTESNWIDLPNSKKNAAFFKYLDGFQAEQYSEEDGEECPW
jgi:hypothetical protein